MTQEGITEELATDRYGIIRRLRAAVYVCPDSLLRSKDGLNDRLDPLHLVKAKKYRCDIAFAVQHDCCWNTLVVVVVCQFACRPTDGKG
jgi:hypothetical protein